MESEPSSYVPAIYVAKYNHFVDNILERINKILSINYDPVTVKLTNPNLSSKLNKKKNKSKSKKSKYGSKKSASGLVIHISENINNEESNDVQV